MRTTGDVEHELTQCRAELAAAIEREERAEAACAEAFAMGLELVNGTKGWPIEVELGLRGDALSNYNTRQTFLRNYFLRGTAHTTPEPCDPINSHAPATVLPPVKEGV